MREELGILVLRRGVPSPWDLGPSDPVRFSLLRTSRPLIRAQLPDPLSTNSLWWAWSENRDPTTSITLHILYSLYYLFLFLCNYRYNLPNVSLEGKTVSKQRKMTCMCTIKIIVVAVLLLWLTLLLSLALLLLEDMYYRTCMTQLWVWLWLISYIFLIQLN